MSRFTSVAGYYNDYPLPINQTYGYAREILDAGTRQLSFALQSHSQVFLVHLTLTFPSEICVDYNTDNSCFQFFIENYTRYLAHHGYDPGYLWVREVGEQNSRLHYHLLLFLNGHHIQFFNSLEMNKVNDYWTRALQRLLRFPESGSMSVHVATDNFKVIKANPETFIRAIHEKISYLAKIHTKEVIGRSIRCWGQSLCCIRQ